MHLKEGEGWGGLSLGTSRDESENVSFGLSDLQMEMAQWLIMYESGARREGQGLTERWEGFCGQRTGWEN